MAVPSLRTSALISTFMSLRKRSPGMGISSPTPSSRASGWRATRRKRRTKSATNAVSLTRSSVMTYEARSRPPTHIAYLCEPLGTLLAHWGFVPHANVAADTTLSCNYIGGRGRYRTADRWCVKPVLYH